MKTTMKNLVIALMIFAGAIFGNAARGQDITVYEDTISCGDGSEYEINLNTGDTIIIDIKRIDSANLFNDIIIYNYDSVIGGNFAIMNVDTISIIWYSYSEQKLKVMNQYFSPLDIIIKITICKPIGSFIPEIKYNPNSHLTGIYNLTGSEVSTYDIKPFCIYIYKYDNEFCEKKMILK